MTNQTLDRRWLVVFLIFFVVLLTIFVAAYLRLIPTRLADIPYYDTAGHFILYGILAALLHLALNRRSVAVAALRVPLAAALAIAFAIGEEFVQRFSPNRSSDLKDLACDVLGILFFVWLSNRFK